MLVDRFTLLSFGWLVPRFALVDRLEVIKSLYGRMGTEIVIDLELY
jgi:hypothetical protein